MVFDASGSAPQVRIAAELAVRSSIWRTARMTYTRIMRAAPRGYTTGSGWLPEGSASSHSPPGGKAPSCGAGWPASSTSSGQAAEALGFASSVSARRIGRPRLHLGIVVKEENVFRIGRAPPEVHGLGESEVLGQPDELGLGEIGVELCAAIARAIVHHDDLERLAVQGRQTLQIVVVDNGSSDGQRTTRRRFPPNPFIRLPKNFGLTKAMNLGWRAADAEYVFFLHDDAEVEPGAAIRLAETLDANPNASAACPLLVDDAGQPAPQLGALPPGGEWLEAEPSGSQPEPVVYPRGAALMMRVYVIRAVRQNRRAVRPVRRRCGPGGADLRASKTILLDPAARVRHHGSGAYSTLERADFLLGRAVFMGKYLGFGAGLRARLGRSLARLCRSAGASCATPCRVRRSTAHNSDCRGRGVPPGPPGPHARLPASRGTPDGFTARRRTESRSL